MTRFYTNDGKLDYRAIKACADRVGAMRLQRARAACAAAGLCPDIIGTHVHNALVSLEYGKPWPEVNYSLARQAKWHMDRQWDASRILDRLYQRKGHAGFAWR